MAAEPIWTGEIRRVLYSQLVKRFGPLDDWTGSSSPGRGLDGAYDQFCEDFAHTMGAESGKAVKHQIRFAMPESSKGSTWEEGHARSAILNKAAALEAGFIKNKHLPNLTAVGREGKHEPALEEL
jgi:hypothetical protein